VYAGWCTRANGDRHPTALNVGRRPTFYDSAKTPLVEAHLIGFDGDLYGEELRIEFVEFLRSERKFSGLEALAEQLQRDVDLAQRVLSVD